MSLRRLGLCLILLAWTVHPGHGEETAVTLPAGNAYEIAPGQQDVLVPLPDKPAITAPVLLEVALGSERSSELNGKFRPPRLEGGDLLIGVDAPALQQGIYDLKVRVKADGKDQTLNLRITRPAAQLRPPDTLVIDRFVGPWGRVDKPQLPLTETSGKSGLAEIRVEQIENLPGVSCRSRGPLLTFKAPVPGIRKGTVGWAKYDLCDADGLPWGSVQGRAQVTSPQLAAPLPVTFEIHSRRTRWWIGFFAGFGLLCGLGLRTLLPRVIEHDQARLLVTDAIAEVDREKKRQDPPFQQALADLRAKLQTAFETETDAKKLSDLVAAVRKDLGDALSALKVRLESALRDTEALDRLITTAWFLPADLAAERLKAKPDLDASRQALVQSNAEAAEAALKAARGHLAGRLPLLLRDWPLRLEDLLQTLGSAELPAPASMQTGLRDSVTYLRGLLVAIPDAGLQAAFDPLTQTFEATHKARLAARKLLLELRSGIKGAAADVDLALRPVLAPGEDPLRELREEEPGKLETLAAAAEEPETAAPRVQETFLWLDRRLRDALTALLPQLPKEEGRKAVRDKLEARAYGEAAVEIARQIREARAAAPAPVQRQTSLGSRGVPGTPEPPAADRTGPLGSLWGGILGLHFDRADWEPLRLPMDLSPEGLAATRSRIVQELGWVTGLRTGLTWIGLLWLAFLLFHDKPGTLQDFAEVFFWGFGTDVTVDAFWNAAKGYKKA